MPTRKRAIKGQGTENPTFDQVAQYQRFVESDPMGWATKALKLKFWGPWEDIALALRDHPRVAVRSANGVGKSYFGAFATAWFLHSHCPGRVVTTSSSWRGVEYVLWPEIHRLINSNPQLKTSAVYGGAVLRTEWRLGPQWDAIGIAADKPENIAGIRSPGGTLVIVDEASGLEGPIYDAIMGLASSAKSKVLMLGNPLRPSGPFYDAFRSPTWKTFAISAFDVPNVKTGREAIPGLCTRDWVEARAEEWGIDSPVYKARVLGEFPSEGDDTLVPLIWVERALERTDATIDTDAEVMAVDVARFGSDRTVFLCRKGRRITHTQTRQGQDTMATTGELIALAKSRGIPARHVFVDDTGVGGGVVDRCKELQFSVVPVIVGESAQDSERFANLRAEISWRVREAFDPKGKAPLILTKDQASIGYEICSQRFGYTSKGQIKVEAKDAIKARVGKSPDLGDALALTFSAQPVQSVRIERL